jgi:NAD(P)H-flavin reductase
MTANPLLPESAVVLETKQQTYDTITLTMAFVGDRQTAYRFQPGQFNMVSLFGIGEAPISISSEPQRQESFDHTVRIVGNLTGALRRLEPGNLVGIRGPYGSGWPVEEAAGKNVLLVAGGIGLAPLRPVITHILSNRQRYGRLEILYGARTPKDLLYTDEYEAWRSAPDCTLSVTVDTVPDEEEWDGHVGVVTTLYKGMKTGPKDSVVMMCGPQIMMKFGIIGLEKEGFSPDDLYVSLERRMKCGVGMCGHCQTGPVHVCKDGPVFRYSRLKQSPLPVL